MSGRLIRAALLDRFMPAWDAPRGTVHCQVPVPDPKQSDLAEMYAILDDRERPYYEYRLAA